MTTEAEKRFQEADSKITAALAAIDAGDPDWQARVREAQPAMRAFSDAVQELLIPDGPPLKRRRWWQIWR